MRLAAALFLLCLTAACGGASAHGTTAARCEAERTELERATTALSECRSAPPAPWTHEEGYRALLGELDRYEASLTLGDDGNEATAQALATSAWTFLDDLAAEVVDHRPLDAAEDATEALLRDREHDAAIDAIHAMRSTLATLREVLDQPAAPNCQDAEDDEADAQRALASCDGDGDHTAE